MVIFQMLVSLSGEALYTSDFTVPTHALEVINGTVLLCFNNADSVTAASECRYWKAPPTLTVNGDPAGSTVSPGLTRDFTSGTEFKGVTTFDTQGYFVPPSGTTEQKIPDFGAVMLPVLVVFLVVEELLHIMTRLIISPFQHRKCTRLW